jgi:hypothetical protein
VHFPLQPHESHGLITAYLDAGAMSPSPYGLMGMSGAACTPSHTVGPMMPSSTRHMWASACILGAGSTGEK